MQDSERFYGKYRGCVENSSPDELGRIKVTCETVAPGQILTAMPCVPYAGAGVGFRFLPEKDDNVWVEFEAGDPSYPIWSGCFWKLNEFDEIEKPSSLKVIKTGKLTIEIDDAGQGALTITHQNGAVLKIDGNTISSEAPCQITQQVKATKAALSVTGFDVNDGALKVV